MIDTSNSSLHNKRRFAGFLNWVIKMLVKTINSIRKSFLWIVNCSNKLWTDKHRTLCELNGYFCISKFKVGGRPAHIYLLVKVAPSTLYACSIADSCMEWMFGFVCSSKSSEICSMNDNVWTIRNFERYLRNIFQ